MPSEKWKVVDLLQWVKAQGLWPSQFQHSDRFVMPVADRIVGISAVPESHRDKVLWIPSRRILPLLKERGLSLAIEEVDGVHFSSLNSRYFEARGVGLGEAEAILSALNTWRKGLALSIC